MTHSSDNELPVGIYDLPSELINIIFEFMDFHTWIKFDQTNKYYYNFLSQKQKHNRYKEYYNEKGTPIMFIKGVKYFLYNKLVNGKMDNRYIYCNDCSSHLKSGNLERHVNNCRRDKLIVCSDCEGCKN